MHGVDGNECPKTVADDCRESIMPMTFDVE
jgi:hypothetical protein